MYDTPLAIMILRSLFLRVFSLLGKEWIRAVRISVGIGMSLH